MSIVSRLKEIPSQVRERKHISGDQLQAVALASNTDEQKRKARIDKKKTGSWQIDYLEPRYIEDFETGEIIERPERFLAIYYDKNGNPRTSVGGERTELQIINETLDVLSENVLEQRKWFAKPPKNLNKETGIGYFTSKAIMKDLSIAGLVGADILASKGTIVKKTLDFILDTSPFTDTQEINGLIILGFIGLGVQIYKVIKNGEEKGIRADIERVQDLPPEALNFEYGINPINKIVKDKKYMFANAQKTKVYETLQKIEAEKRKDKHYKIGKHEFIEKILPYMKKSYTKREGLGIKLEDGDYIDFTTLNEAISKSDDELRKENKSYITI